MMLQIVAAYLRTVAVVRVSFSHKTQNGTKTVACKMCYNTKVADYEMISYNQKLLLTMTKSTVKNHIFYRTSSCYSFNRD